MFKTKLAVLAVLALGLVGFGGVQAATADAAFCNSRLSAVYHTTYGGTGTAGYYGFDHILSNCTGVNGYEFRKSLINNNQETGFWNQSNGVIYRPPSPYNPIVQSFYGQWSSVGWSWYHDLPCSSSQAVQTVIPQGQFRIRNASTGTWGPWHVSTAWENTIWCGY